MECTPQSTRSPNSSYRYISNPQPLYEYPSPAHSDSVGIYPMSESVQSPTTNNHWASGSINPHGTPRSSHSTPNILSAEYDPFAEFQPEVPTAYSHDIYSTASAEVSILPVSPALSGSRSHRSSFSPAPPSEGYTHVVSAISNAPRIKMEDHPDYGQGHGSLIMTSSELSRSLLATSASYGGNLDAGFYQDPNPLGWPKMEYGHTQDLPSISSLSIPPYGRRSESQEAGPSSGHRRGPPPLPRTRAPRRMTTKEEANFQCQVKGCEKLFGRSYNFKAHMETHDSGREYPFPCPLKDCTKKFVRKTDLQRHHQSVHMKQRNHRCEYCSRFFARKDTLRRHMEDGCSKRFDIEHLDLRPQSYNYGDQPSVGGPARSSGAQSRQPSYSSSIHYSPPPTNLSLQQENTLTSDQSAYLDRQEYLGGSHQEPVWPH